MDIHEHGQATDSSTDHGLKDELTPDEKEEIYARASRRARMKMGLYIHATVFVCVILLLVAVNLLTTPGYLWVLWPFFGWGLGLFLHWFSCARLVRAYRSIKTDEIARQLERRGR